MASTQRVKEKPSPTPWLDENRRNEAAAQELSLLFGEEATNIEHFLTPWHIRQVLLWLRLSNEHLKKERQDHWDDFAPDDRQGWPKYVQNLVTELEERVEALDTQSAAFVALLFSKAREWYHSVILGERPRHGKYGQTGQR